MLANIQKKWLEFCLEGLKSLKDRNIYKAINFSKRRKVIKNYWAFNIKSNSHYRSQLVTKEFFQIKRIDFNELFSLVVHYEIAYLFLAVAILKNWNIHSIDIKTTFG